MLNFLILVAILILFYLLSKSAALAVDSIKKIGLFFHIPIALFGIVLGFLASLPELSVAVNASARDLSDLSLGNLLGGIPVLFGLILGISVLFSRSIKTSINNRIILPVFGYAFLPFILGLNGEISLIEGTLLIIFYFILVFFLFREIGTSEETTTLVRGNKLGKKIALAIFGILALILISNLIVRLTETLLEAYNVPAFFIGFLIFSIGTNLPEIAIAFQSIQKKVPELSTTTILGSAIANPLIIGILSIVRPIPIEQIWSYVVLSVSTGILLLFVSSFYTRQKSFSKKDGVVLVLFYIFITLIQVIIS